MRHGGKFIKGQIDLYSAKNTRLQTTGTVDLKLEIGPRHFNHHFVIMDGLSYDVVLGRNFLRPTRATISFRNNCVTIKDASNKSRVETGTAPMPVADHLPVRQDPLQLRDGDGNHEPPVNGRPYADSPASRTQAPAPASLRRWGLYPGERCRKRGAHGFDAIDRTTAA